MRVPIVITLLALAPLACGGKQEAASLASACDEKSDWSACNRLARMHFEGVGATEDKDWAILLFDRACRGGYSEACSNLNLLARLYADGAGVPKDSARAADLYQKACRGGVAEACRP